MEKNAQDQNLGDAPDDSSKTFNPPNALSAREKKGPVGPLGEPQQSEASKATDPSETMRRTQTIPVDQTDHPSPDDNADANERGNDKPLNQ